MLIIVVIYLLQHIDVHKISIRPHWIVISTTARRNFTHTNTLGGVNHVTTMTQLCGHMTLGAIYNVRPYSLIVNMDMSAFCLAVFLNHTVNE